MMDGESKSSFNILRKNKVSKPNPLSVMNVSKHQHSKLNQYSNFKGKGRDVMDKTNAELFKNKSKGNVSASKPKHVIRGRPKGGLALALEEYNLKKVEEHKRREENRNKKEEMNKALQRYKEKKAQKLKRIGKKTKKGQPIMKYWIEDLLQKIQSTS